MHEEEENKTHQNSGNCQEVCCYDTTEDGEHNRCFILASQVPKRGL